MQITTEETSRITQYLDLKTSMPQQADLVFVFGSRYPEPAYMAADLVRRGITGRVVVTGGQNQVTGRNEAAAHLEILLANGVPRDDIIVEDQSANTLENVALALPLIARCVARKDVHSIVALTKWYHCCRAMMTLRRYLRGVRFFPVSYEPADVTRSGWWLTEEGCGPVFKEWRVIPEYLKQGGIAEIQLVGGAYV